MPPQRFTEAIYQFMFHDLGNELVDFDIGHLQVFSNRGDPTSQYSTVQTIVRRQTGELIHVTYSFYRNRNGWKIFDTSSAGVSVLLSVRQGFAEEMQEKGLDELTSRLAAS